jgi:hypothetical protein
MNVNDVLLEMCNVKDVRIKELEKELEEALANYEEYKKRTYALGRKAFKLDEIREEMTEIEYGDFSSMEGGEG